VYRAICESHATPPDQNTALEQLSLRMSQLAESSSDPLTLADAVLGLRACHANAHGNPDQEKRVVERLLNLRRQAHWEPSWFSAYGGSLEATAAAVEVMAQDPVAYSAQLHEASQYLLGTRDGFGTWRNGAGTLAVLRALATMPASGPEVRSTVVVKVNGKEVQKASIDLADPFISSLSLSHLSLTGALAEGKNMVSVTYDGALEPPVLLEERRPVKAGEKGHFAASRKLSQASMAVGEDLEVELSLSSSERLRSVAIEEPLPSNAAVDVTSLEALKKAGAISEYRLGERLVMYVKALSSEPLVLRYRLLGDRKGTVELGPTRIRPVHQPELTEEVGATTQVVVQ
jgi:hypothetical protein